MGQTKLENFYEKYGFAPVQKDSGVVNPGAKSVDSLLDKAKRNIEMGLKNKDFTLADARDMVRGTIICDSYDSMTQRIRGLKMAFPDMTGYISRCPNGYRGVHLNVVVDGVYSEIQLSTSKAFEYGQAAENIYKRWRSFSPDNFSRKELEDKIQKGEFEPSDTIKSMLEQGKDKDIDKALILQLAREQREQYKETEELFGELHSDGSFASAEKSIEGLLLSYSAKQHAAPKLDPQYSKPFPLDENGKVDVDQANKYVTKMQKKNSQIQQKFINLMEKSLQEKGLAGIDEEYVADITSMLTSFDAAYAKKLNSDSELDPNSHLLDYSINKSNMAMNFAKFCEEHGIDFLTINDNQMDKFLGSTALRNPSQMPSQDELKSAMKESKPKVEKVSPDEIKEIRKADKELQIEQPPIQIEPRPRAVEKSGQAAAEQGARQMQ